MNVEETAFHLFLTCSFSQHYWQFLGIQGNLMTDFLQMMIQAKQAFPYPFFMEVFIISAWQIWKQRNDLIFMRTSFLLFLEKISQR